MSRRRSTTSFSAILGIFLILTLCLTARGDVVRPNATTPPTNTLPAQCARNDLLIKSDANPGQKLYIATSGSPNCTWEQQGSSASIVGSNGQVLYNANGIITGLTGCNTADGINFTCNSDKARLTSPRIATSITDGNGNPFFVLNSVVNAVNGFKFTTAADGSPATIILEPSDQGNPSAVVNLLIRSRGIGSAVCIFNCGPNAGPMQLGAITNLTSNGRVVTSGGIGTLSVDTDKSVRLELPGSLTISDGVITALTFGVSSEVYDTDTMHDTGTNTDRITFTTAGKYHVCANVEWGISGVGLRALEMHFGIADVIIAKSVIPPTAGTTDQGVCTDYSATAGSFVKLQVFQNSGGPLGINAGALTNFTAFKFN